MTELARVEVVLAPAEQDRLAELAAVANREHRLAREAAVSMIDHAVRCGEALLATKAHLRHGEWLPWLEANFEASARTAQGYMRLAANAQRVALLPELSLRQAIEAVSSGPVSSKDDQTRELAELAAAAMRALKGAPKIGKTEQLHRYKAWRIEQLSKGEIRALPLFRELQARHDELAEENKLLRRDLKALRRELAGVRRGGTT